MANHKIDGRLIEVLRRATSGRRGKVVVLTGAGVSAGSGVPTFRDALTGLWAKYDPMALATPGAFAKDPALVSEWYDMRRMMVLGCEPNEGHRALVRLEDLMKKKGGAFCLLTQNVDRLHQRAGSETVVELHGSLLVWRDELTGEEVLCDGKENLPSYPWIREDEEKGHESNRGSKGGSRGGMGMMRPGVVWFGEMLPEEAVRAADEAVGSLEEGDVFLSVGTSGVVYPAAGYMDEAKRRGAVTVEVNLERTALSDGVDWCLLGRSEEVLGALVEEVMG
ncbi:NAD-dependent protein deacylase [Poriferisphaera corsica]|uniref:NAD-dependent protein deacylase n=1 Tax=Poriferisphaera corsica TaxID=2528020 RepID=A0A517YPV1_9BACT|nr:Sir2 family NAD-dependent protein deacetylase [Poriferisphaera corsica]QDU32254.1 NAD-dependent protein deacylase [Poriferisphaera corsica]